MAVIYTPAAQADIASIFEYIATEGGLAVADRVIDAIVATSDDLGLFPGMGRRRPELDDFGLQVRSIGERGYVILYTEHREAVHIVRVIHGARDLVPELMEALIDVL